MFEVKYRNSTELMELLGKPMISSHVMVTRAGEDILYTYIYRREVCTWHTHSEAKYVNRDK